jgi:hypothetical protein
MVGKILNILQKKIIFFLINLKFKTITIDINFFKFKLKGKDFEFNCIELIPVLESYTPSGLKCITLFSDLITTKYIFDDLWMISIKYDTIIDSVFIHPNITPPHLYINMIEVGYYDWAKLRYLSKKEHLLPYLYETNCFDYRKNSND